MREEEALTLIMAMFILAGAGMLYVAIVNRRKLREMEHRERLAMIERGLMPPPERDPAGFEASARFIPPDATLHDSPTRATAIRFRTAGVLMIGFGLGLMMLITFAAGEAEIGVGVGGAFAVLGGAALLNYFLMAGREPSRYSAPVRWTPPSTPPEPPSNVAP